MKKTFLLFLCLFSYLISEPKQKTFIGQQKRIFTNLGSAVIQSATRFSNIPATVCAGVGLLYYKTILLKPLDNPITFGIALFSYYGILSLMGETRKNYITIKNTQKYAQLTKEIRNLEAHNKRLSEDYVDLKLDQINQETKLNSALSPLYMSAQYNDKQWVITRIPSAPTFTTSQEYPGYPPLNSNITPYYSTHYNFNPNPNT